ncbi:MAG: peptidoglycan DD-metalloendopeptidase family protein [Pseudomonadota bacterium]
MGLITLQLQQAFAQDQERLDAIEQALEQDQTRAEELGAQEASLQAEIKALRARIISTASQAQDLEEALSSSESKMSRLEQQAAERLDRLHQRENQLGDTLAALQRIALRPPDTLIVAPGAPIDAARGALLLSYAVPALETRASDLRGELSELESLRKEIAIERDALRDGHAALELERQALDELVARKQTLEATTKAERKAALTRSRSLAAEARSMRELLERLEREAEARRQEALRAQAAREAREQAERDAIAKAEAEAMRQAELAAAEKAAAEKKAAEQRAAEQQARLSDPAAAARPDNVRPFPSSPSRAHLVLPARGRFIKVYGQVDDGDEEASKGLSIATRGRAQVVAPFDGKIAYAGPFRGYGQILIIEHGGRYHTLLAGLERVDALEGQWVLAGEPVGVMGGSAGSGPVLYVELRRTGQPINPLPWFANSNDKVQG